MGDTFITTSKIFKEDLSLATGGTGAAETGRRLTSAGAYVTATKIDASQINLRNIAISIEDQLIAGNFILATDSLSDADDAAVAANKLLVIPPGDWSVAADLTLDADVQVLPGADLQVATGKTLTFTKQPQIGNYQVFTLSGTGAVAGLKISNPVWFGALDDASTDNTAAMQAAMDALDDGGTWVLPQGNDDYLTQELEVPNKINIRGDGSNVSQGGTAYGPTITAYDSSVTSIFYNSAQFYGSIRGLCFDISPGTDTAAAIDFSYGADRAVIQENIFEGGSSKNQYGIKFGATDVYGPAYSNQIRMNEFYHCKYPIIHLKDSTPSYCNANDISMNTFGLWKTGYAGIVRLEIAQNNLISLNNWQDDGGTSHRIEIIGSAAGSETRGNVIFCNYFDGTLPLNAGTVYLSSAAANAAPAAICLFNQNLFYDYVTDNEVANRKVVFGNLSDLQLIHALTMITYVKQYRAVSNDATSSRYPALRGDSSAAAIEVMAGDWNDGAGLVLMGKDFSSHANLTVGSVCAIVRDTAGAGLFVHKTSDGSTLTKVGGIDKDGKLRVGNSAVGDVTGDTPTNKIEVFDSGGNSLGFLQTYVA